MTAEGPWAPQNIGENLSVIVAQDDVQDLSIISHQCGAVQPPFLPQGGFWWSTNDPTFPQVLKARQASGDVTNVLDPRHMQLNAGATVPLAADMDCGLKRLKRVAPSAASTDAIQRGEAVLRDGSQAWTGIQNAAGNRLINVGAPSAPDDAVRLRDLTTGVAQTVYGSNRAVGNSSGPFPIVRDRDDADGSSVVLGFVPRRLRITVYGNKLRRQSDGSLIDLNNLPDLGYEFEVNRLDADTNGGFPGSSGVVVARPVGPGVNPTSFGLLAFEIDVQFRYVTDKLGFWITIRANSSPVGEQNDVYTPVNGANGQDGSVLFVAEQIKP